MNYIDFTYILSGILKYFADPMISDKVKLLRVHNSFAYYRFDNLKRATYLAFFFYLKYIVMVTLVLGINPLLIMTLGIHIVLLITFTYEFEKSDDYD